MTGIKDATAVLFDFDGTLADSISAMKDVYREFAAAYSFSPTDTEFDELNGPSLATIIDILQRRHGLAPSKEELFDAYTQLIDQVYATSVRPHIAADALLSTLHAAGKRLFLVTSASPGVVKLFLSRVGFVHYFTGHVFGNEVTEAKPNGAIYQLAISRYQIDPSTAIVVEDSPNGVLAARNAGLDVIAFSSGNDDALRYAGASSIISSLTELLDEFSTE